MNVHATYETFVAIFRPQKTDSVTFSKLIGGEYGNEWHSKQAGRGPTKTKFTDIGDTKG